MAKRGYPLTQRGLELATISYPQTILMVFAEGWGRGCPADQYVYNQIQNISACPTHKKHPIAREKALKASNRHKVAATLKTQRFGSVFYELYFFGPARPAPKERPEKFHVGEYFYSFISARGIAA
jgi:hypothetical protein